MILLAEIENPKEIFSLHHATSTDETRPALQYIYFQEGKVMATDGHIAAARFINSEQDFSIHKDICKELVKEKYPIEIYKDDESLIIKKGSGELKLHIRGLELPEISSLYPTKEESLGKIGINPILIDRLRKAFVLDKREAFVFTFSGPASPILINSTKEDNYRGLVMPIRLT